MTIAENLFENLRLELRRGCLTLAVLAQLRQEHYGYTLRKDLAEHGLVIDESTLYPLLRRLEAQGLLVSEWREEEKRNKRFYRLSSDGERMLGQLLEEWQAINASINRHSVRTFEGKRHGPPRPLSASRKEVPAVAAAGRHRRRT